MKYILVLLLFIFQITYAQEPEINLKFSKTPIQEVLRVLEEQSHFTFSFESSLLNSFPPVTLNLLHSTLANALEQIFRNSDVEYKIKSSHIILKKRRKPVIISGTVIDAKSKEPLINATIYDWDLQIGTVTNAHGIYSLSLPGPRLNLTISYVGYKPWQSNLLQNSDTTISVALEPVLNLKEVIIKSPSLSQWIKNIQPGQISFSIKTVNKLPGFFSESDLLKTIQLMPGVKTGTEGMSGLFVRGGNMDENLYLMDGIPIYNPSHLLGFFSTFNSDAVKNVEFYKSSFPARFGGRLSSIVDVRLKDGDMENYHGNISIGLIASKFNIEGPLFRNKTAFNLSARRTYADLIASPLIRRLSKVENKFTSERLKAGYYFADINAKITHKFSDHSRLSLNLYWGNDKLRYKYKSRNYNNHQYTEDIEPNYDIWTKERQKARWNWGNLITSLEWNYNINNRLNSNTTVAYNRYMSLIRLKFFHEEMKDSNHSYSRNKLEFDSGIHDWIVKNDFIFTANPWNKIRFGVNYTFHTFIPETSRKTIRSQDDESSPNTGKSSVESKIRGHELSLYAEDEIALGKRIRLQPGIHLSMFQVENKTYLSLQPRLSIQYTPAKDLSLKASYTKMNQYVHLLTSGGLNMPTDLWVPVTRRIRPMLSHQVAGGLYYHLKQSWEFSLEAYYKIMKNQIEYVDGAGVLPDYRNWDEKVAMGKGNAYGIEVQLQKIKGKTSGWINYTLSWANRRFPDKRINYGKWFPAKYDNRHSVNVAFMHKFSNRFDISTVWVFNSGSRTTLSLERYNSSPVIPGGEAPHKQEIEHYEYRNNYRMENYHRLDIGFNFHKQKRRGTRTWSVNFYNTYCRKNPFMLYTDENTINGRRQAVVWKNTIFPILPSFSYTFTF